MLGVLLSLALSVSPLPSELGPVYSPPWMGELTVLLEFLPASGQGVVAGDDTLCDNPALTPHLVGDYFCLNGDGTQVASAGMALSAVGSPTTDTRAVCSNGPDCTARTGQRLNGTGSQYFQSASRALASGDMTSCALVRPDSDTGFQYLISHSASATGGGWSLYFDGNKFVVEVGGAGANNPIYVGSARIPGALSMFCGTFDSAGAGKVRAYVDGALTTNATASAFTTASLVWRVGYRSDGAFPFGGTVLAAFHTSKRLTDAEIVAVSAAALGTLAGTKNEVLTLSRNTVSTCCRDDGTGCVVLPPNRACWAGGRLKVRPVVANLLAQSDALDNAAWAKSGATVVVDAAYAPNGTVSADLLKEDTSSGNHFVYQNVTTAVATYTFSRWVKAVGRTRVGIGTNTHQAYFNLTNCTAVGTAGGATGTAKGPDIFGGCRVSVTWNETATSGKYVGTFSQDISGGTTYQGDGRDALYLAEAQLTQTATVQDYCPTGAAPASCAVESPAMPNPLAGKGPEKWCVGVTVKAADYSAAKILIETGAHTTANAFMLTTGGGEQAVSFLSVDAAGSYKLVRDGANHASNTTHRLVACNTSGTLKTWVDGAAQAATLSSSGTGIVPSHLPTLYLGARSGGILPLGGSLSDVRICLTEAACL